jgi:hypothetical protein
MLKSVALFVSLALLAHSAVYAQAQLNYKVGQESHFTLSTNVDTRGQTTAGSRSSGMPEISHFTVDNLIQFKTEFQKDRSIKSVF